MVSLKFIVLDFDSMQHTGVFLAISIFTDFSTGFSPDTIERIKTAGSGELKRTEAKENGKATTAKQ